MFSHELAVIHAVELIAREDQHFVDIPLLEEPLVLANGIGGAFKPTGALRGLLSSKHFNKPLVKTRGEVEGLGDVAIEGGAVELSQHVDLVDPTVDAVADWDINQAVLAGQRNCWLGAHFGEGIEARTSSTSENDPENPLHPTPCSAATLGDRLGFRQANRANRAELCKSLASSLLLRGRVQAEKPLQRLHGGDSLRSRLRCAQGRGWCVEDLVDQALGQRFDNLAFAIREI